MLLARRLLPRIPETVLQPRDILLIDMDRPAVDVEALARDYGVDLLPRSGTHFADHSQQLGLVDVMLPYEPRFVGKTVAEVEGLAQSDRISPWWACVGVARRRSPVRCVNRS